MRRKILLFLMVLLVAILSGCRKKIDALDYFDIEIEGLDGYATATVKPNVAGLEKILIEKAKLDVETTEGAFILENYFDRLEYFIDPTENLKNGDTVTLKVYFDADRNEKVRLVGGEKKVVIQDLPQGKEVDIFKDVKVKFSGASPQAKAEIVNKSKDEFIQSIIFDVQPSENLKIGDKVKVTANYSKELAFDKKYIILKNEKEYTLDKLDTYLDKVDVFKKDLNTLILKSSEDIVNSYIARDTATTFYELSGIIAWDDKDFRTTSKLSEAHFLLVKEPELMGYSTTVNRLMLFYEISLTQKSTRESVKGYVALSYDNLVIGQDGKVHIPFAEGGVRELAKDKETLEKELLLAVKDKYYIEAIDLNSRR